MTFWFVISVIQKRNDVADIAWGIGFILMSWASFAISEFSSERGIIVGLLVTIWGVRLAWHIYLRNRGKPEDYRYAEWRAQGGKRFYLRSYGQIYLLQGVLLFLIVSPVLMINRTAGSALGLLDLLGIAIWIFGFYFESVGDKQLAQFIKNPENKGKLLETGLWRYTRHPNYFGEITQWWGIWILSLASPLGWLAIIGPITITILIVKISGIPLLEKKMQDNPAFADYAKRTNKLIPWLPKSSS
jgi:steroid 5-alpha reductase family enzyme